MFGARRAAENYEKTSKTLHIAGVEKERYRIERISAAESLKFATVVTEMIDQIKKLGPSPLNKKSQIMEEVQLEPALVEEI